MHSSLPPPQPLIDPDAGRRYLGAHRHRRDNAPTLSPTRSPYPLPSYHLCNTHPEPSITTPPLPATVEPSSAPRHLRHSVPDVIYKHGPRIPSSSSHACPGAVHGARARFVSLPAVVSSFPKIDTECDRLERACGRAPAAHLRLHDDPP